jgi:hypothetical protein
MATNLPRFFLSSSLIFFSKFLVCISCSFLPYKYTTPWVIVCFRLEKKKWMGRRQHLPSFPCCLSYVRSPLLDLLHMKQHHVTECCLKLLLKSRAVHLSGSDFRRCVSCSWLNHAFENWRKMERKWVPIVVVEK